MSYVNFERRPLPLGLDYVAELLRFRHLALNLVSSTLRSRFRRSRLGILWAVIQPLGFALIIAWAWGFIMHLPTFWDFAVYVYAGMIVWEAFGTVMNNSLEMVTASGGYLKQARIPLLIFQARTPLTGA